jgi:hypothetical protein
MEERALKSIWAGISVNRAVASTKGRKYLNNIELR